MSLDLGSALCLDPPVRIVLANSEDAVAWARSIPDFGFEPEVFALFLDDGRVLLRAVWLSPEISLDDLYLWPAYVLGYSPGVEATGVLFLVCRPGEGVEPWPGDFEALEMMRLAHDAHDVPLVDVVLVDERRWRSLAEAIP